MAKTTDPQPEVAEPETGTFKALGTFELPYSRMAGSIFDWPFGEDVDRWLAQGRIERIGNVAPEPAPKSTPVFTRPAVAPIEQPEVLPSDLKI